MRLALVTAVPATDRAALVLDAIWAAARPEDGLEHVSVKFRRTDIVIGIFTASDRDEGTVSALLERVCEMSPALNSWNLTGIRRLPFPDTS